MLTDSHLHLNQHDEGTAEEIIAEAQAAAVTLLLTAGVDVETSESDTAMAARHPGLVWAVVGVHPWFVESYTADALPRLRRLLEDDFVVGIGEVGLDFVRSTHPEDEQRRVFEGMLTLAADLGMPLFLHGDRLDRRTHAAVLEMVRRYEGLTGAVHGFDADAPTAQEWLEMGFSLSFNGVVTWPDREPLREVVRELPEDRILVETDTPAEYQPQARRPEPNHPSFVQHTVAAVAEIRDTDEATVRRLCRENVLRSFPRLAT